MRRERLERREPRPRARVVIRLHACCFVILRVAFGRRSAQGMGCKALVLTCNRAR